MAPTLAPTTRADFFVHPDYLRMEAAPAMTTEIERYEAVLEDRIDSSPLPILIHDPRATQNGDFWDLFPAEQRFPTKYRAGRLDPKTLQGSDWDINELLREQNVTTGVVHGSYLGQCVEVFWESLWTDPETKLLHYNESIPSQAEYYRNHQGAVKLGFVLRHHFARYPAYLQPLPDGSLPSVYADDAHIFSTAL